VLTFLPACDSLTINSLPQLSTFKVKVKVQVMLRLTVSRPVCLRTKHPSGGQDHILVTVRQLRVFWCGAPSLTRGRVCRLQLLLAFASAVILGTESHGTRDYILLPQIWDYPNLEGQVSVFIPQKQGGPFILIDTGFTFQPLLRLAGLRWRYSKQSAYGITVYSQIPVRLITFRHVPHRKHCSTNAVSNCCRAYMLVCEAAAQ
jgi:hypothetical protein